MAPVAFASACGDPRDVQWVIPDDRSLDIAGYLNLGIPDPGREWSLQEYQSSVSMLAALDRSQLPRARSAGSGSLFDRLVDENCEEPGEILLESTGSAEDIAKLQERPNSLGMLYRLDPSDHFVFDRELIEIEGFCALRFLALLPRINAWHERIDKMLLRQPDTEEGRRSGRKLREQQQSMRATTEAVTEIYVSRFLLLGTLPAVGDDTRLALLVWIEDLVRRFRPWLSSSGTRLIAQGIEEVASLDENATIRVRLDALAREMHED